MKIDAIHLGVRLALLDSGDTVPITNLFDAAGEEVDCAADAISFVAGEGGTWFAGMTADFETAGVN